MRAILVSVDYADLLAITLPYNRHHFKEIAVVTSLQDSETVKVAEENNAIVFRTNLFYEDGAVFNKWRALEYALDLYGREGWLCVMDADVLWPKTIPSFSKKIGNLYTPRRRMRPVVQPPIPKEEEWTKYHVHRNEVEFAGYSQIFHADDPVLGEPPWHEINWTHAGGADSFFQQKWAPKNKIRPPFEVLHLGASGTNWLGRASELVDGTLPEGSIERQEQLREYFRRRRRNHGGDRFKEERINL